MSRTGARIPSISSPEGNDDDDENEHRLIFSSVLSRTPTTDDDDKDDDENNNHSFRSLSSSFLPSPLLLHSCIFFLSVYVLRISFNRERESSYSQECTQTNKQTNTRELKKKNSSVKKLKSKTKKKQKKIKRFSLTFQLSSFPAFKSKHTNARKL
jgi:hypothetical protein